MAKKKNNEGYIPRKFNYMFLRSTSGTCVVQFKLNYTRVFFYKWYEKGVKVVYDCLDEHGNILQRTDFQQKLW